MTIVKMIGEQSQTDQVIEAINNLDETALAHYAAWQPLADLSSRTEFEAMDGDPDSVVVNADGRFEAIATIFVTLGYGSSNDESSVSDEYIATVRGLIGGKSVMIDTIQVDTSPFYD